ncbi:MAG: serine/threonine-protein kinase [Myxococcales bacterium]|nr:serine/threonine protein kinase [Polyangiaceae bacterium]MDW8250348.1 serine/threonine-protein kinase [Myxococcales bacterium]
MTTGVLLGGVYALIEPVAAGGSSRLYRAEDRRTGQQVACKLSSECSPAAQARFAREATLLSSLDHPGIVRLLDQGMHQGSPFLVLEWLEGISLATALESGPFPIPEAIRVVRLAAEAAGEVHRKGLLHGDLSPANVMLVGPERERVVLIDFGVGFHVSEPEEHWGTPGYMAPEQASGEGSVDARADVFSLGCLLFRCIAGRGPFVGATLAAILAKVLIEPVPPLSSLVPGVEPALDKLLAQMFAKNPTERLPDGKAVAQELEALATTSREPRRITMTRQELRSRTLLLLSNQEAALAAQASLGSPMRLADGNSGCSTTGALPQSGRRELPWNLSARRTRHCSGYRPCCYRVPNPGRRRSGSSHRAAPVSGARPGARSSSRRGNGGAPGGTLHCTGGALWLVAAGRIPWAQLPAGSFLSLRGSAQGTPED